MSKSALTVLREARELISDPKRWTSKTYSRNKAGNPVMTRTRDAVCWCASGAVMQISTDWQATFDARQLLGRASDQLFGISPVQVNDLLGHVATLRMFDAAIASAEKEAGNAVQA